MAAELERIRKGKQRGKYIASCENCIGSINSRLRLRPTDASACEWGVLNRIASFTHLVFESRLIRPVDPFSFPVIFRFLPRVDPRLSPAPCRWEMAQVNNNRPHFVIA